MTDLEEEATLRIDPLSPAPPAPAGEEPGTPEVVAPTEILDRTPSQPQEPPSSSSEKLAQASASIGDEGGAPPQDAPRSRSTEVVRVNQPAEALPVLARATATSLLRAAAWGLGTSLRLGAQVARAATDPTAATQLYSDLSDGVRNYAREFLGVTELEREVGRLVPSAGSLGEGRLTNRALREQGAELLRAAADVGFDESAHPAYARMLSELTPDEARILRLLATSGAQPLVDIRQGNLIGLGSQLIAQSLNMLGAQAGLQQRGRVSVYLANLSRLGLIDLEDAPIEDTQIYQVLEAQPDVLKLIKETARARTVHRSVNLTPLGVEFCDVCLPVRLPELPPSG